MKRFVDQSLTYSIIARSVSFEVNFNAT